MKTLFKAVCAAFMIITIGSGLASCTKQPSSQTLDPAEQAAYMNAVGVQALGDISAQDFQTASVIYKAVKDYQGWETIQITDEAMTEIGKFVTVESSSAGYVISVNVAGVRGNYTIKDNILSYSAGDPDKGTITFNDGKTEFILNIAASASNSSLVVNKDEKTTIKIKLPSELSMSVDYNSTQYASLDMNMGLTEAPAEITEEQFSDLKATAEGTARINGNDSYRFDFAVSIERLYLTGSSRLFGRDGAFLAYADGEFLLVPSGDGYDAKPYAYYIDIAQSIQDQYNGSDAVDVYFGTSTVQHSINTANDPYTITFSDGSSQNAEDYFNGSAFTELKAAAAELEEEFKKLFD